jgi:hypothetical protein
MLPEDRVEISPNFFPNFPFRISLSKKRLKNILKLAFKGSVIWVARNFPKWGLYPKAENFPRSDPEFYPNMTTQMTGTCFYMNSILNFCETKPIILFIWQIVLLLNSIFSQINNECFMADFYSLKHHFANKNSYINIHEHRGGCGA